MENVQHLVCILLSPTPVDVEQNLLQEIQGGLLTVSEKWASNVDSNNVCERELVLTGGVGDDPYPGAYLSHFSPDQISLNKFTCYVFDRRFGWSEVEGNRRVRRLSCTGATVKTQSTHQKAGINDILDTFIRWYFFQNVSREILQAFSYTLKTVCNMPVVRNRTVIHVMDWLKQNTQHLTDPSLANPVIDLIMLSLTDVWSAVRVSCSSRLGPVAITFSTEFLKVLSDKLIGVSKDENSSWQAKEGTVLGLCSILRQYTRDHSSRMHKFTLTDEYEKQEIPDFISSQIHDVVFLLLSHPQLTIRDNAVKVLSTYISCLNHVETLVTLENVIKILNEGMNRSTNIDSMTLPMQFPDAYRSEGLLNVCISVIKVLPMNILQPNFLNYLSVFVMYLSHPASTVRQASSSVFKYLVSKSSHNVGFIKLILQNLSEGWEPCLSTLNKVEKDGKYLQSKNCSRRLSVSDNSDSSLLDAWESREGRLFAYELVMKFLIKNHWLYTFGPAGSGLSNSTKAWQHCSEEHDLFMREGSDLEDFKLSASMPHSCDSQPSSKKIDDMTGETLHTSESDQSFAVRFLTRDYTEKAADAVQRTVTKAATVDKEDFNSLPDKSSTPKNVRHHLWPATFDTTFSVLMQIQVLERVELHGFEECCLGDTNSVWNISSRKQYGWQENVKLVGMTVTLNKLLLQALECITDSQWELRRMGQQVLPCLSEVIRWYDISILEDVWNQYLTGATSPMTFGGLMLLRESIVHAAKLLPLLHHPPVSWQDHESCKRIILNIVDRMKICVPGLFGSIAKLLQRKTYDKISVMAADILITINIKFDIPTAQKRSQTDTLIDFWKSLFCFAHPNTRIAKEMPAEMKLKFSSPYEGYLSCCLVKPDNDTQCARQVEKLFITETYPRLSEYMQGVDIDTVSSLLPMLAHYIGLYMLESQVCRSLSECLNILGNRTVDAAVNQVDKQQKGVLLKRLYHTLKELAAIITIKSTDKNLVQKVGYIYLDLCKPVNPSRHLPIILVAICARVNETIKFIVECSPKPDEDLFLMSNEIPLSYSSDSEDSSDEDSVAVGSPASSKFPECLTLNTSNNSGSFHSGRLSALSLHSGDGRSHTPVISEKDGDSDWDSWDEEEEKVESGLNRVFADFLHKLKSVVNTGTSDAFMKEVRKLGDKERTLIPELMDEFHFHCSA